MFWEIDRDFKVVYANRLLKEVFGDPVGLYCHDFMACETEVCPDCPVREVFTGESRAVSERPRRTKDGRVIWVQHTATPIKNTEGDVIGAYEMIVDITQRRQLEAWLRDSERHYRNLVEEVPDVLFSIDGEGRFTFVNTQIEKTLGYTVRDILETKLSDYVAKEDVSKLDTLPTQGPDGIWDEEVAVIDAEGERKFVRIRCKAVYDGNETPTGYDGVLRDRTERKKLEEELRRSREALVEKIKIIDELYEHIVQSGKCKAIEQHTAEVAHELRQPLAIVGGFARRMARQLDSTERADPEKQRQYLGIIESEISRLEKILDRLIDFTKRGRVQLQRMDPNDLIRYVLRITEGRMQERNIQVEANLGSEAGEIPLDPGRFQQLVLNLVGNAIEASPEGGTVKVETGFSIPSEKALQAGEMESDGYFEMKIRNGGGVVSPEGLNQIFNPFFTTKEHGTGLGLTVSKKIVEDHHGSISVKSDDSWTVFTVWLPLN